MSALSNLRDDLNGLATSLTHLFGGGDTPVLELKPGQVVVEQSEIDTLKAQVDALGALLAHVEARNEPAPVEVAAHEPALSPSNGGGGISTNDEPANPDVVTPAPPGKG